MAFELNFNFFLLALKLNYLHELSYKFLGRAPHFLKLT